MTTRPPARPLGGLAVVSLLLAPAVDELCSAAPTVGAPALRADLVSSVRALFLFGTVVPVVGAMIVEPALLWWLDGRGRRGVLLGAGAAWAAGYTAAGLAPGPWAFALALAVSFVAAGVALGLARAALVAADGDVERSLARWTLAASVGDWLGPLAIAAIAALGGGWRAGLVGCGLAVAAWTLATARAPLADPDDDDEVEEAPGLRDALSRPWLVAWLAGVAACTLLDELFVAGTALWGADRWGLSLTGAGLLVACEMTGGVVGGWLLERRGAPPAALAPACALSLLGLFAAVAAPDPATAGLALFVCGVGGAAQYPLALAAAHRALPGHPGRVEALGALFAWVDLVAPMAFGAAADAAGLGPALLLLGLQPALLLALAVASARR